MTRCAKCRAAIRFERTVNDKLMPLDVDPVLDGNVVIREGVVRVLKEGELPAAGELRYVSHFKSCTAPEAFRQPRKGKSWDNALAQHEVSRRERPR